MVHTPHYYLELLTIVYLQDRRRTLSRLILIQVKQIEKPSSHLRSPVVTKSTLIASRSFDAYERTILSDKVPLQIGVWINAGWALLACNRTVRAYSKLWRVNRDLEARAYAPAFSHGRELLQNFTYCSPVAYATLRTPEKFSAYWYWQRNSNDVQMALRKA